MNKVVITGATGFIGSNLSKALLSKGVTVYAVDTIQSRLDQLSAFGNVKTIVADFSTYKQLANLIDDDNIDCFYHIANGGTLGGSDLNDYTLQLMNTTYACEACMSALSLKCKRFVLISSTYQYMKDIKTQSYNNIYGLAKKSAEDMCRALLLNTGVEYNIAVLTNTFGIGDHSKKATNTIINKMICGENLLLIHGERKNDWVYIDDTVQGLISVGNSIYENRKYYIGHEDISTFRELIIQMRDILSPSMPLSFGTIAETSYVDYSKLDASILKQDTDFECTCDFKSSILKTVEWIKSQSQFIYRSKI